MNAALPDSGVAPPSGNLSEQMMKNAIDTQNGRFSAKIYRGKLSRDPAKANTAASAKARRRPSGAWEFAFN